MSLNPDRLAPLLPFLLPVVVLGYGIVVAVSGLILRRRRRRVEAARRAADPRQPWHRWLDEINRRIEEDERPGAIEKWRE